MSTITSELLTTAHLHQALDTAERWLARNRDAINAINVYPVPDGDTGTNMLLTLHAALAAAEPASATSAGAYLQAVARGALLGARGNSGVILSQMLRGFAAALARAEAADRHGLCRALEGAARAAYETISNPVEGTMLTVMRDAAEASSAADEQAGASIATLLLAAQAAAERSVERTPELLPLLRQAGVVDAGGLGIAVLLAGVRMGYLGETLPDAPPMPAGAVELSAVEHEGHGYCTEYVVEGGAGTALDRDALLRALEAAGGESVLVVGDEQALHVHVHIADPGPALSAGVAAGGLLNIKIDNMRVQHEQWVAGHELAAQAETPLPAVALVAMARGTGIAAAFRELGAVPLLTAGSEKPSAGTFLEAARRAASRHVFLLPNDKDTIMAAEQAAAQAPGFISVIPSWSLAAGMSAAVAYLPGDGLMEIGHAMRAAIEGVRCIEVTWAARDAEIDGLAVTSGQPIALFDGSLVAKGETIEDALLAALTRAVDTASEMITVYLGADAPPGSGGRVRELIQAAYPDLAVETVAGGQPSYPYIVGVE